MTYVNQFGIDFLDKAGTIVQEMIFEGEAERDQHFDLLDANQDDDELWPENAARITAWSRQVYRQPICGVDYGPGSVKRRFGGGYVPRSAYQFGRD